MSFESLPIIRCFTCGKVIAGVIAKYWVDREAGMDPAAALAATGIPKAKWCCRARIMGAPRTGSVPMSVPALEKHTDHYNYLDRNVDDGESRMISTD